MDKFKIIRQFILLSLIALLISYSGYAQSNQHFKMLAQPSKLEIKEGEKFSVKVTINFEKTWHSYGTRKITGADGLGPEQTKFRVEPKAMAFIDGKMKQPKMVSHYDDGFETKVDYLPPTSVFEIPLKAKKDLDLKKEKLSVIVHLQQCNETSCLPPDDFKAVVNQNVYQSTILTGDEQVPNTDEAQSETSNADNPTADTAAKHTVANQTTVSAANSATTNNAQVSDPNKSSDKKGFWATLLLSMLAGLGALVTPCVFPMIPITVSFFTKRSEQNQGRGLRDASVYALGIIITFTMIGFLVSLLLGPAGMQNLAASPWFNLAIVAIFLLFGFSLFGAYELQMPTSWTNKLNTKSNSSSGISAVILMAITFALSSFSCTGPFIAAALVEASQGQWFYPIISMLGFSTMLAAPFFLLALFPTALNKLPRAGGWMNNVKVVMGFIVLAITLKYLNNALLVWNAEISRDVFMSVWIVIALLGLLYIIGVFKTPHDSPVNGVGVTRILIALLFGTWMFYMVSGLGNSRQLGFLESFLPAFPEETVATASLGSPSGTPAAGEWMHSYKDALADAKAKGRNLLVDFTGKTCTNCKVMEKKLYPNPQVQELFAKFSRAKLYTDEPENKDLQLKKFNTVALPLYVIIDPDTEQVIAKIELTQDPAEFITFLKKGIK